MKTLNTIIGLAAGAAAITAAGVYIANRNKPAVNRLVGEAGDMANSYKNKLNDLTNKAKKEFKRPEGDREEFSNTAKERPHQM